MMVTQLVIMVSMAILTAPAVALLISYLVTNNSLWALLLLPLGVGLGVLYVWLGVKIGGKWLDGGWPELMQATVRNR
jgi:ABC-2 type transport system permease protein